MVTYIVHVCSLVCYIDCCVLVLVLVLCMNFNILNILSCLVLICVCSFINCFMSLCILMLLCFVMFIFWPLGMDLIKASFVEIV